MPDERILIVEDEMLIALELSEILKSNGYNIVGTAATGQAAIELAEKLKPNLVLMDIRLKGSMDGIDTATAIKNSLDIPLIFLSALADRESVQRAKFAEPYGYIVKPFHEKTLITTIEMVLHKSGKIEELKKKTDWFLSAVKDIGESILICDMNNTVIFVNTQAEKLLGVREKDIEGKVITDIFMFVAAQTKSNITIPNPEELSKNSHIYLEDLILRHGKNREIHIDLSISLIGLGGDGTVGKILLVRDISGRKQKDEKIKKEIDTAIVMQRKLLPRTDSPIRGIETAWFLHPCSLGAGDLLHIIPVDKSHISFYIFDVMGHGIPATITSLLVHRLLSPDREKGGILRDTSLQLTPPIKVLTELNKQYYGQKPFQFITCIYGIMNTETGITKYVRAGHNYPILLNRKGEISEIVSEGAAIGLYPEMMLAEKEFTFHKGERLFLYSDGLVECMDKNQNQFSVQKLFSYIRDSKDKPLREMVKGLEQLLFNWRGTNSFDDDISFMAIERS